MTTPLRRTTFNKQKFQSNFRFQTSLNSSFDPDHSRSGAKGIHRQSSSQKFGDKEPSEENPLNINFAKKDDKRSLESLRMRVLSRFSSKGSAKFPKSQPNEKKRVRRPEEVEAEEWSKEASVGRFEAPRSIVGPRKGEFLA